MPIEFLCPDCRSRYSVPRSKAGTWFYCDTCRVNIPVPQASEDPDAPLVEFIDRKDSRTEVAHQSDAIATPDDEASHRSPHRWWRKPWVWVSAAIGTIGPPIAVVIEPALGWPLFIGWVVIAFLLFAAAWLLGLVHAFQKNAVLAVFCFLVPFYFVKVAVRHWPETRKLTIAVVLLVAWLTAPFVVSLPIVLVAQVLHGPDADADAVAGANAQDETGRNPAVTGGSTQSHPSSDAADSGDEWQQRILSRLTYQPPKGVTLRYRATVATRSETQFLGVRTSNSVVELRLTSLGPVAPAATGMLGKFESLKRVDRDDDGATTVIEPSAGTSRMQSRSGRFSHGMNSQAARAFLAEPFQFSVSHDAQKIFEVRLDGSLAIHTDHTPGDVALVTGSMSESFRRATDAILMPLPSKPSSGESVWYIHHAGGSDLNAVLTSEYRLTSRQPGGNPPTVAIQVRGAGQDIEDTPHYHSETHLTRTGEYRFNTSGRIAESGILVDQATRLSRSRDDGEEHTSRWRLEVQFALIEAVSESADPNTLARFERGTRRIESPRLPASGPMGPDDGPALLTAEELAAADQLRPEVARPKITGDPFGTATGIAAQQATRDPKPVAAAAPSRQPAQSQRAVQQPPNPHQSGVSKKLTPPEGFDIVNANTPLLPGLSARVKLIEWNECEILRVEPDGSVTVRLRMDQTPRVYRNMVDIRRTPRSKLAVRPDELRRAADQPDAFQASLRLLPGSESPLAENELPIPDDLHLVAGIPLLLVVKNQNRFQAATLISTGGDGRLIYLTEQFPGFFYAAERSSFAIDRGVVEELRDPESAAAKYADALKHALAEFDKRPTGSIRGGRINQPAPDGYEALAADTQLPYGTQVHGQRGRGWYDLTVVRDSPKGNVLVYWNERRGAHVFYIARNSLIINANEQARLRGEAASEP